MLALALLSIGLNLFITRQIDGAAAAVNEASRLRMQAWRLSQALQPEGRSEERVQLVNEIDGSIALVRNGNPQRPLAVPWNDDTRAQFDAVRAAWSSFRSGFIESSAPDSRQVSQDFERFISEADGLLMAIENSMARLTAMLNLFQLGMMAFAVLAGVLCLYFGHLFVLQPLQRLRSALQQMESGDFSTRVSSSSRDEFGEVAAGFNHMAQTLEVLYNGLEYTVQEKTRDLELERSRLTALYEVSTFLAASHNLEELANGFAQKMRQLSGSDATAVRWADEACQRYLMLGSDCLPEGLAKDEHCLQVGLCACGQPLESPCTKTTLIHPVDRQSMPKCAEADYAVVVIVPIKLQQRVLGELDLFYRSEVVLGDADRGLYEALAGHFANAAEYLRTEALVREAAVSQERSLLARELHDSIAQSLAFLKIQVTLLRHGLAQDDHEKIGAAVNEIDTGVRESTQDVRELLVHFRTRTNCDDIEQALRTTLKKFEHQSGIKAHLEMRGHGVSLPSDVQLQVLHVVQEALTNARKHAQASDVYVSIEKGPRWRFEVRDNGLGFQPMAAQASDTHVGVQMMRERAERIGAQVQVQSAPGKGTKVTIEVG